MARAYSAHPSIHDHGTLRRISRCPDKLVSLKRDPQCISPQASLVLIYQLTEGKTGRIVLVQPQNRTPNLWCGSAMRYHSATGLRGA
ncbi:hypothetical protein TNCV_4159011 [Trichonephila clavipes]|nr:hypothetical protein TNCV_4159011 [Trichonephila clavipes]